MNVNTPEAEDLFKRIRQVFPDMYIIVYSLGKSFKDIKTDFTTDENVGISDSTNIRGKTKKIMELILEFWKRRIEENKQ